MTDKDQLTQYMEELNQHILPHIDYGRLQESYDTNMAYAKGVLNRLHQAMVKVYGSERLGETDGRNGFALVPGIVRGKETGNMCIALLELDLSSSGEHWGTTYLCKYGVVSQTYPDAGQKRDDKLVAKIKEMNKAFVPYDYCYTATIPGDIHVHQPKLPDEIKSMLGDFRNHKAFLLNERPSASERLREAAKETGQPAGKKGQHQKSDPAL